jgi:isochorismate synthase
VKYRLPGKSIVHVSGEFQPWNGQEKGFLVADFLVKHPLILMTNDLNQQFDFKFSAEKPYQSSHEEYIDQAKRIHQQISSGKCEKVVLSRTKSVFYDTNFLLTDFERLCDLYPTAFVYIASTEKYGTWIGATPELLLQKTGNLCETVALASTKKRTTRQIGQTRNILSKLWSMSFLFNACTKSDAKRLKAANAMKLSQVH